MSRTVKGSKGPGWEPWSNRHEKAAQRADYLEEPADWQEDECRGCRYCICVKCGAHVVVRDGALACLDCGHDPERGHTTMMTGRRCPCCYSTAWQGIVISTSTPNRVVAHRCGQCGFYEALPQPRSLADAAKPAADSASASDETPCK